MYHSFKNKLLLVGLGFVSIGFLASCDQNKKEAETTVKETKNDHVNTTSETYGKIAFVNIDSLEANYEYFKNKKIEFDKKQKAADTELQRMGTQFQNKLSEYQQKAQSGALTQTEGEKAEKELAEMQQNFEKRQQNLGNELMKEQDAFSKELKRRLDDFLEDYNADKNYAYILSYADGGSILFADKAYDITDEIIKGMNAESQKDKDSDKK